MSIFSNKMLSNIARICGAIIFTAFIFMNQDSVSADFPGSTAKTGGDFDFGEWREMVSEIDLQTRNSNYPGVWRRYFNANSDNCARNYIQIWGPLGIRTRMHDKTWANEAAFKRAWPELLLDPDGNLVLDAFEVVSVSENSPAYGHVQSGDLLLAMDGEIFKTSTRLFDGEIRYHHQERRGLEMHAGLLLDRAEGRGKVSFDLLRPPGWTEVWSGPEISADGEDVVDIQIPIQEYNSAVRLYIEATRDDNGWCWANVIRPRFLTVSGEVDLSEPEMIASQSTGWGSIERGRDVAGNPIMVDGSHEPRSIGNHADGYFEWRVPDGTKEFRAQVRRVHDRAVGFRARVETEEGPPLIKESIYTELLRGEELGRGGLTETHIDLPVTPGEEITVQLEVTRGNNGHCHAELIEPVFIGTEGEMPMAQISMTSQDSGWGGVHIGSQHDGGKITYDGRTVENAVWYHAPGQLSWKVPEGVERFRAVLRSRENANGQRVVVRSSTVEAQLPKELRPIHEVVSFEIPRIGSFQEGNFPERCPKSDLVARMTAAWLADKQRPDGSWRRAAGYTHNGYDTAYAGLGLLSTGNPEYEDHIRKAAHYIAFQFPQDDWAIPHSMLVMFLAEYWLRTGDDEILPSLQSLVGIATSEFIAGDWTAGHKRHPGYGGWGLSAGGSHMALAVALAELTPVEIEPYLLRNILDRVQELAPTGYVPYGRETGDRVFTARKQGASFSGRHGPYLIAALVGGGTSSFTENASLMYSRGGVGGIDQGHATATMSTTWGLLAAANVGSGTLARHMEALEWKMTMMRTWEGGYEQSSYRLELVTGEGLLPEYIRAGAYLMIYNSHKRNMAMTGSAKYRSSTERSVAEIPHRDAATLSYYQRNWGVVDAILGDRSPALLKRGLDRLLSIGQEEGVFDNLFKFLLASAPPVAAEILGIEDLPVRLRSYLAEMVVGADFRLSIEPERDGGDTVPGSWNIRLNAQYPFSGYFWQADNTEKQSWRQNPPLPMEGKVEILTLDGELLGSLPIKKDFGGDSWHTRDESLTMDGPEEVPVDLIARIRYTLGEHQISYDRPVIGGGHEPGNREKGRKLLGDRRVMVPGELDRDVNGWSASFKLPSGQYVSAASQGVILQVRQGDREWNAPGRVASVPRGARGMFEFSSGWHRMEARVGSLQIAGDGLRLPPGSVAVADRLLNSSERDSLFDFDSDTGIPLSFSEDLSEPLKIDLDMPRREKIRAIDIRLEPGNNILMEVQTREDDGSWRTILRTRTGWRLRSFAATETSRLRIMLTRMSERAQRESKLTELHLIRER